MTTTRSTATGLAFVALGLWLAFPGTSCSDEAIRRPRRRSTEALASTRFDQSTPLATPAELAKRLGYPAEPSTYDVREERFEIFVPDTYSTNTLCGALVWISPGRQTGLPVGWAAELVRQRVLFVAACHSGNERATAERCRLALDAAYNVSKKYRIDRRRLFVGGFSGGGRIASALGVAYPDVFAGTICVCGVDFYEDVPASAGGYYLASYRPGAGYIQQARKRPFVLITGERDMNRDNTRRVAEYGFQRAKFTSLLSIDVPEMTHRLPDATIFRRGLEYLSGVAP